MPLIVCVPYPNCEDSSGLLGSSDDHEEGNRCELQEDGCDDDGRDRHVVQETQEHASQEPEESEARGEYPVSRGAALWSDHRCDDGGNDRLVHAEADPPDDGSCEREPSPAQESEGSVRGGEEGE